MGADPVTVAIPVLNAGERLAEVLMAVQRQRLDRPVEILVADSGSTDDSVPVAKRHGAKVISVAPGEFSHGGTRNLLFERASGTEVAFLTQDAVPADEQWLASLLRGFDLAPDVALVFGPYLPRSDSSPMVARELEEWFGSFAPDGSPQVDRGREADGPSRRRHGFFTDANGCVARTAWERVPFRTVAYAEDRLLARDMLNAGYSKAYHPAAAVIHSHEYSLLQLFQRSFDEWRGLREIGAAPAEARPARLALTVQRQVRDDLATVQGSARERPMPVATAVRSLAYHVARSAGAALGSRAERLPRPVRRVCSLESRASWMPVPDPLDTPVTHGQRHAS